MVSRMDASILYDITLIDIPVKRYSVDDRLADKLNTMYSMNDNIFNVVTGHNYDEKKYYYSSGLLCLSTYLKERGHTVGYINYPKDESKLKSMILVSEYVGFSTITITIQDILELAKKIKTWNPEIKIILGGYHATYCAKELLMENKFIYGIILGEGEIPLAQLLSGVVKDKIKGFCYKLENGEVHINREEHFLNEAEIPLPDFSLIENDIEDYNLYIGTMRGCVGKCKFCVNHNYWGKPRFVSIEKLEKMFSYLSNIISNPRLIHIIDNVFTIDKIRLEKISDIVLPYVNKFAFECDTLSCFVDKERIRILERMNVIKVGLGFEDCDNEIIKRANKIVTFCDNIKAVKMIKKYASHICIYAYWLIGLPGMSEESVEKNIRVLRSLISHELVHIISPKIFIPYPGTDFYEHSMDYNLYIISKDFENYERISPPYPYYLDNISSIQLEQILQKVLDTCMEGYVKKWDFIIKNVNIGKYNTWYEHEQDI